MQGIELWQPHKGPYDVVIIGGGIQGAGIARDAAMRGLAVLLCERDDFAQATSSNSSKLIHGGLRYLERLEMPLVYESLRERAILLNCAKHLVRPLKFMIPFSQASRRPPWRFRLGLRLYDMLAGKDPLPRYQLLQPKQIKQSVDFLGSERLRGGATYWDCQMDDSRLVIHNILAAREAGAQCINYSPVEEIRIEDSGAFRLTIRHQGKHVSVKAKTVVNASGPWIDDVLNMATAKQPPLVKHAKGIHLVLQAGFPLRHALLLEVPGEERIFFIMPWNDLLLVGTTDTPYDGMLEQIRAVEDDVAYLHRCLAHHLTRTALKQLKPIATMAGVRPLTYVKGRSTRDISRHYRIHEEPRNLWSIIGGKYTVHRKIAEKIVDKICTRLQVHRPCRTATTPLVGSPVEPWEQFKRQAVTLCQKNYPFSRATAEHLVHNYGTRWHKVAEVSRSEPTLAHALTSAAPHIGAEVVYAIIHEQARQLEDFFVRRTKLFYQPGGSMDALELVATIFQRVLGTSQQELAVQKQNYRQRYEVGQELLRATFS